MVVLGLGSNIADEKGDRLAFLRKTIHLLKSSADPPGIEVLAISPIYESDALLPDGAPLSWNQPYLNLAVLCQTDLSPLELLKSIKKIERQLGRKNRGRWAPREIDIDILTYDSLVFEHPELKIPHPSLLERPFAIFPFTDLVPHWSLTQTGPFYGMSAAAYVEQWKKRIAGEIPFRTRRTSYFLTELVGILNVTPDSFSDGGTFFTPESAFRQAQSLHLQGAKIIDVGAESTRPGAKIISPLEEWERLAPILSELKKHSSIEVSIDTRNEAVAAQALHAGVRWINDVSGFQNPKMQKTVVDSQTDLVMMHSLTVPADRTSTLPKNCNPIDFLLEWGETRIHELSQLGISRNRIIFDPGIGFGKTVEQSWEIFRRIREFRKLGVRILVGHSRKSFLSSLTSLPAAERDLETTILTVDLAMKGVDYLRVHQVEKNFRSLKAWTQIDGVIRCYP